MHYSDCAIYNGPALPVGECDCTYLRDSMAHEYPFMLFKHGGPHEFHGSNFHTVIVNSFEEEQQAVGNGWFTSSTEAYEDAFKEKVKSIAESAVAEVFSQSKKPTKWSK